MVGGDAISNFIVDIGVLNRAQLPRATALPLVITKSYWDETNWADGAYAGGKRVSKGEFYYNAHTDSGWPGMVFDSTTYNGITATIAHPAAMSVDQTNHENQGLPLGKFATNLPYVKLSDGRSMSSVAYPTSVAFDAAGRLWVADNGPDQNYKIFNVPASGAPSLVGTFGEPGGVFAGPVKGRLGTKRFWGPRGVGFGDNGEIIIGNSGIPGQVQGGTDVRVFDRQENLLWEVKAIFMHAPDVDPTSNGTSIHTAGQRFEMDYSKPPGKSWKQAAVTIDPFRFPGDPRLSAAYEIAFVRVVNGRKFLYATQMSGLRLAVFRFEANSEIAIPVAVFGIKSSEQGAAWAQGRAPVWDASLDANKNRRLFWRDQNGNGQVDAGEFGDIQMPATYTKSIDVDELGNIWVAGALQEYSSKFRYGGNLIIPFGSIDANGVPFLGSVPRFVDVARQLISPSDQGFSIGHMRYLSETDTALLATGNYYAKQVYVIDGHQNASAQRLRFKLDLGYNDLGVESPDINRNDTTKMVLPTNIAADPDYLYVGYIDRGPDAKVRGEITVYSMKDGTKVGWIVPGPETNGFSGNFDMVIGIQVRKLADGTRVILAEENGGGKFMVYRWDPTKP